MKIWIFLKENWTLQLKQCYHQNFNISLFIMIFAKTCYNVDNDHFLKKFEGLLAKSFFFNRVYNFKML